MLLLSWAFSSSFIERVCTYKNSLAIFFRFSLFCFIFFFCFVLFCLVSWTGFQSKSVHNAVLLECVTRKKVAKQIKKQLFRLNAMCSALKRSKCIKLKEHITHLSAVLHCTHVAFQLGTRSMMMMMSRLKNILKQLECLWNAFGLFFFRIHLLLSLFKPTNGYNEKNNLFFKRLGANERVSDSIEKEMNMVQVKMLGNVLDFYHKRKLKVIQR